MNRNFRYWILPLFLVFASVSGCGYHMITSEPPDADVYARRSSINENPGAPALKKVGKTPFKSGGGHMIAGIKFENPVMKIVKLSSSQEKY